MTLRLEVFPDATGEDAGIARFDNFKFIAVPKVQDSFYLASQPTAKLQKPAKVDFVSHNPTKTTVQVQGARTPFYLVTGESYSPQWRLELSNVGANTLLPIAGVKAVPSIDHVKLNSGMNGWYVDPTTLCAKQGSSCSRNADGSYDISMVMEFTPQRWMATGAVVSGITFVGGVGYFAYDLRQDRRRGVKYRLWR
jgi:hypothetical protein